MPWEGEDHRDKANSNDITQRLLLATGVVTMMFISATSPGEGLLALLTAPFPSKCAL